MTTVWVVFKPTVGVIVGVFSTEEAAKEAKRDEGRQNRIVIEAHVVRETA